MESLVKTTKLGALTWAAMGIFSTMTGGCTERLALHLVTPSKGPDNGLSNLEIQGKGFSVTPIATFNGLPAPLVLRQDTLLGPSTSRLLVSLPASPGAQGPVPVTLSLPDGQSVTSDDIFEYYRSTVDFSTTTMDIAAGHPSGFVTADLNADGKSDLLIANQDGDKVRVFLGQSNGTFTATADIVTDKSPRAFAVADFDRDGRIDMAVVCAGSKTVQVLFGTGDGKFDSGVSIPVGDSPLGAIAADLNGDNRPDLVVNSDSQQLRVLLSDGSRNFKPGQVIPVLDPGLVLGVVAADLNRDKQADLIVSKPLSQGVQLLLGRGDGNFAPAQRIFTEIITNAETPPIAADVNKDSQPDLLIPQATNGIAVQLGNGAGGFTAAPEVQFPGIGLLLGDRSFHAAAVADLDSDRNIDLVLANDLGDLRYANKDGNVAGQISVLIGRGDGTFAPPQHFPVAKQPKSMIIATLAGYAHQAILVTHDGRDPLTVLRNQR